MSEATLIKRELFWVIPIGTFFRFVGGRERFLKTTPDWCVVDGQPNKGCHVPPDQTIIDLGEWTNITPN